MTSISFKRLTDALLGLATAALLVGCGGGGGDDGANSAAALTCGVKELKLSGTLDGADVSLTRDASGYGFENKIGAAPGKLTATTATGQLLLEFSMLTANGRSSPARGNVTDADAGLSVGNCETGDFVSTLNMDADGNGAHFTLAQLRQSPYCMGAAVSGTLAGCIGFTP